MKIKLPPKQKFVNELTKPFNKKVNFRPLLLALARVFRKSKLGIFLLKSPGGYRDLKPGTKKQKRRKGSVFPVGGQTRSRGQIYPILLNTGSLGQSIVHKGHPMAITKIGLNTVAIGTRHEAMPFHESGTSRMPARPMMFWGPEARPGAPSQQKLGLPRIVGDTIKRELARLYGLKVADFKSVGVILKRK